MSITRRLGDALPVVVPVATLAIFLVSWEALVHLTGISPLILPPPSDVGSAMYEQAPSLVRNGLITLLESVAGFIIGGLIAVGLATSFVFSDLMKQALYPYAIALRAVPLIALAPIVIIWTGSGYLSKITLAAIISFFPILVNLIRGFTDIGSEALDMMRVFGASEWQVFSKIRVPNSLPYLFAGLKISSSFSVIGAIVAEFTGATDGIGYLIKSSSYYTNTDLTFAGIIVAALIGLIFFGAIVLAEGIVVYWESDIDST